jgi:membrane protein DedA with SNARE-associated domain
MQGVLDWLGALPPVALYLAIFAAAAVENFFPPAPSDVVIAFASFLAARGGDTPIPALVAVLLGNVGGAAAMYALGRRYGAGLVERRFEGSKEAQRRVEEWYGRYGLGALFVSRFLPGLRAVVPPLAGALKIPAVGAIAAMGVASAIWYGIITALAFRAGSDWKALQATITRDGRWLSIAAAVIVAIALSVWFVRRRARARR